MSIRSGVVKDWSATVTTSTLAALAVRSPGNELLRRRPARAPHHQLQNFVSVAK
jgi:hypothetical protein